VATLKQGHPAPAVVADRIRAERLRLGLGKIETARKLGVTKQSYAQLETAANPRLTKLIELAGLGFDVRAIAPELFGRPGFDPSEG
jgi:transcriptional regulator with XRE-family HTH domain